MYYPKKNLKRREGYINSLNPRSVSLCKLRLGDIFINNDMGNTSGICPLCKEQTSSWTKHIILECHPLENVRSDLGLKKEIEIRKTFGLDETSILREILEDTGMENKKILHTLYTSWEQQ